MDPSVAYARTADGVSIAYLAQGSGPGFVLMPGVPFSNVVAEWQIPVLRRAYLGLADRLRIVQYDGRGTGHSQRVVDDLSFDAMLLDVEAVVDAAGLDRFALFGFYHSALHAIAYAARHPERVSRLILFGGALRGWEPMSGTGTQALLSLIDRDWDTFAESIAHAWLGWPDDEEGRLAAAWFRTASTPEVAARVLREASAVDVTRDATAVRCETLVLHRRDATVIPLEVSERLVEAIPGARLRLLDGSSAALFFDRTDEMVDILAGFVTGSSTAGGPKPPAPAAAAVASVAGLTPRELEVLRLLAGGRTNAEIAGDLGLSVNTIERHVGNVYRKIDARGRADATAWAIRRGLA
ncbi:MAG TPA: alpha/beta fold hydrolase [Candidatus Limnocylindrales bacterium]|nr:alpha/beta fold hydrolase [Candidatus Limnocylindrales bacterium]